MAINILSHTLVAREFTSLIPDGFASQPPIQRHCCCVCKDCRMTSQVYKMKGAGHKDRANPPFCFYCWSTLRSIVPRTSARLYSVDYQHWGDFAELKEITVSINRFLLLPFLLLCASSISFSISIIVLGPGVTLYI